MDNYNKIESMNENDKLTSITNNIETIKKILMYFFIVHIVGMICIAIYIGQIMGSYTH